MTHCPVNILGHLRCQRCSHLTIANSSTIRTHPRLVGFSYQCFPEKHRHCCDRGSHHLHHPESSFQHLARKGSRGLAEKDWQRCWILRGTPARHKCAARGPERVPFHTCAPQSE